MVKSRNWLVTYTALSVLDTWTTLTLLPRPDIGERNPLVAQMIELVGLSPAIYSLGLVQVVMLAIFVIYSGRAPRRIGMFLRLIMLTLLASAAINNLILLAQVVS